MGLSSAGAGIVAAVVTVLATPLVMLLARRAGVLDWPGPLKPHAAPVPYLGGLAIFCGVAVSLVGTPRPLVLVPLAGALVLGLLDDITSLPVLPRLLAEVGIGASVAWSVGLDLSVAGAVVVVATVVLVNAVNFVDGIDALATGACVVTFLGFTVVLDLGRAPVAAAFAGAAAGFLVFNRPPARIYLGDAGSYLLGTSLALLAAAHVGDRHDTWTGSGLDLAVTIALVGYPIVEVVSTVARRLISRRPLFAGDRDHVYDRMVRRGFSTRGAVALLLGAQSVVVALAVAADALAELVAGVAVASLVAATTVLASLRSLTGPRQ
ncbi:MAG: undecaprenyl/decaprenyl-phosphate alpha-N-acetylglucosaminyl 1-phosphate transferase [Nocardioidaceae bacterium]|nr:undecaprenyl/decaprenyl-phosphate alpha-N-acetylglucosaminyl 1-phosphate transferase [Nocardioidaceae bacterium]